MILLLFLLICGQEWQLTRSGAYIGTPERYVYETGCPKDFVLDISSLAIPDRYEVWGWKDGDRFLIAETPYIGSSYSTWSVKGYKEWDGTQLVSKPFPDDFWFDANPSTCLRIPFRVESDSLEFIVYPNPQMPSTCEWILQCYDIWYYEEVSVCHKPQAPTSYAVDDCYNIWISDSTYSVDIVYSIVDEEVEPCQELVQVYIPNAFSPNGDGINDSFQSFPKVEFKVFSRWGNLIYEGDEWDGGGYPTDSYVWMTEFASGSVTLLR